METSSGCYDLNIYRIPPGFGGDDMSYATLHSSICTSPMNRRVKRQILIALGIFAGIVLAFALIAQVA